MALNLLINPQPVEVVKGNEIVLNIETNADNFSVENKTPDIITFDESRSVLSGIAEGEGHLVFSYTKDAETKYFNYYVSCVTKSTNDFNLPTQFFTESLSSLDVGKVIELEKAVDYYDSENSVVSIKSSNNQIVSIQKVNDVYEFEAKRVGSATITINCYRTNEEGNKILATEYHETFKVKVIAWQKEDLEVSPKLTTILVGEKQKLNITTKYNNVEIVSSNPEVVEIVKGVMIARKVGNAIITIKGSSNDKLDSFVRFEINVANELTIDKEPEITTFGYDEELPRNLSDGAIVYKTGKFENSPVIEYKFHADTKKYSCIGIKFVKYDNDGEAHSIAFMAEEGTIDDKIYQYKTKLFEMGVDEIVSDKIIALIQNDIRDYIASGIFEFKDNRIIELKEEPLPKWTGIIITNFERDNTIKGTTLQFSRRINCNGIEEKWLNIDAQRVNDFTNDDELTRLFDKIEPYKTMERLCIPYTEFRDTKGDDVYTKEVYERWKEINKVKEKLSFALDTPFRSASWVDAFNSPDAWFVPIKKCHYIDIEFSLHGENNRYYLKCIGEKEFSVNLRDYFPNATGINVDYFSLPKAGWKQFKIEDMTITSVLHPAFLNFYDETLEILEKPLEKDYIYIGAFFDVRANKVADFSPDGRLTWFFAPKPMANIDVSYVLYSTITDKVKYAFGQNPAQGINFMNLNNEYYHLVKVMYDIEKGSDLTCSLKCEKFNKNYKWLGTYYANATYRTGLTLELHNKTGPALYSNNVCMPNYRGLEGIIGSFYHKVEGINQQNGTRALWLQLPHSHRYVPSYYTYDNKHWIDSREFHTCMTVQSNGHLIRANSLGAFRSRNNQYERNYTYVHNNDTDRQLYLFGFYCSQGELQSSSLALSSYWEACANVYWHRSSRSCI